MQFSFSTIALVGLLSLVSAAPMPAAGTAASVLKQQTYDALSISAGTAGNAKAEALAKLPINMANLAAVSAADLKIIKGTHDIAEQAEVNAFNPAIAKASGAAKTALQNGKIKNKVLKLTAAVLGLQIDVAQGKASAASSLAVESKKLANNIALDTKAAGQASTALTFAGSN